MKRLIYAIAALAAIATSCREDELVVPTEYDILPVPTQPGAVPRGMYLLNEGNMGSNKSSIDYVDFRNALYSRNMYAQANPSVVMELGDVGNDIAIYGSKLYAVINCSHKVEVMDAHTLRRIGKIDIPNCRYIKFHRGNAYVSSYVGPVQIDPDAQLGAVFRVDTANLEVTGKCTVGYQPDELEIVGEYIYVANSAATACLSTTIQCRWSKSRASSRCAKSPSASTFTAYEPTGTVDCGSRRGATTALCAPNFSYSNAPTSLPTRCV